MRTTIERVRAAVVVGAVLLAAALAGFVAVAHHRAHRLLRDLPERLGADIQKETNGFTYSQSVKGRTVFTIHAAKATQHKDGRTGLDDVGIVLYGKDGRADRIRGRQFEYDQRNGVVRAMGEVQMDLQAPAGDQGGVGKARGSQAHGGGGAEAIHAVTSGLVYVQRLGVASTDQPIRFAYRGMSGEARGATYNSETGVTTLASEVRVRAERNGRPTVLLASHAEMDQANHRLTLQGARYEAGAKREDDTGRAETMTAGLMVVQLRPGGDGVESAVGTGGVEVASGDSRMAARDGVVHLNSEGRAETAEMTGEVRFRNQPTEARATGGALPRPGGKTAGETVEGEAARGMARFDGRGEIERVRLTGGVTARSQGADAAANATREMRGEEMDLQLAATAGGSRRWVQGATMRGDARVRSPLPAVPGHTAGTEEMRGDVLTGTWREEQGAAVLHEVRGEGHTEIRRSRDGVEEVSRGKRLQAEFGAVAGPARRAGVLLATQDGGVEMERVVERKGPVAGAAPQTERTEGRAQRAVYDATTGEVKLAGEVEVADGESTVRADRVVLAEGSGDAEAEGTVQVTYRPATAAGENPLFPLRRGLRLGGRKAAAPCRGGAGDDAEGDGRDDVLRDGGDAGAAVAGSLAGGGACAGLWAQRGDARCVRCR